VLQSNCTLREDNSAISTVLVNSCLTHARINDNKIIIKSFYGSHGPKETCFLSCGNGIPVARTTERRFFARCYIKYSSLLTFDVSCDSLLHLLRPHESGTSVATATGYRQGKRLFSSSQCPDQLWSPPNLLSSGYWELFPGVKRPERESDHLSPSSA
jgi:hypothetical protein